MLDLRDMKALEIDADGRTAWAEPGLTAGEYTAAAGRARARDRVRRHRLGRASAGSRWAAASASSSASTGSRSTTCSQPRSSRPTARSSGSTPNAPRPVLGDPRRRRQLRRRDPVPIPAPRGADDRRRDADPAGHARDRRRVRRRRGGGARRALDDRQRDDRAADAVPAPRRSTASSWSSRMSCYAGGRPRPASERSRRSARSPTPLADMLEADAVPGACTCPEERDYHPIGVGRTMFLDRVGRGGRRDDGRPARAVGRDDARGPAPRARRRDGARARRRDGLRASRAAGSWSTSPRSSRTPRIAPRARGMGRRVRRRRSARATTGAYVNFLGDEGEERVRAAYPGATWDRLREIKRRYDPATSSGCNQNIPPAT